MQRKIVISDDGSHTFYVESLDEHYHSSFGAISESKYVFIEAGLLSSPVKDPGILEIGFGTGLNALLTFVHAGRNRRIKYFSLEKYPLQKDEWTLLNYTAGNKELSKYFHMMHSADWNEWLLINTGFTLFKSQSDYNEFTPEGRYDIVYFDAFSPDVQPDLWCKENFEKLYRCMNKEGILVTYSAKGVVRRVLIECGFKVEKLPGPQGKRHMLRAYR